MIVKKTYYRIHAQGQLHGLVSDVYQHTYEVDYKPSSMEEVRRIADDFQSFKKLLVEEVVTTTRKSIIHIGEQVRVPVRRK